MAHLDRVSLPDRQSQRMVARQLAGQNGFIDIRVIDCLRSNSDPGKQVEATRTRRGEDQLHQAAGPGPPRPGMKR